MKYERDLTADEVEILNHDLLDIPAWINGAIDGKINNCLKRAAQQYRDKLKSGGSETLPANDAIAFKQFVSSPDYKNRVERDAIEVANRVKP